MTDVCESFFRHLGNLSPNEAMAETYKEVSEDIACEIYENEIIDRDDWEMLLKIINGLSRANLILPYFDEHDFVAFGPSRMPKVVSLIQTFRASLSYLIENYDRLMYGEDVNYTVDNLEEFLLRLDQEMVNSSATIETRGFLLITKARFQSVYLGLSFTLRSIMGQEKYSKFSEEFNKYIPFLKKYYFQVLYPPNENF